VLLGRSILINFCTMDPSLVLTIARPATPRSRSNPMTISFERGIGTEFSKRTCVPDASTIRLNTDLNKTLSTLVANWLHSQNGRVCVSTDHGDGIARLQWADTLAFLTEDALCCVTRCRVNIPSISCLLQKLRWLSYCGSDNTFHQVGMSKPKSLFPMGKE
jgi:hypothetical protein